MMTSLLTLTFFSLAAVAPASAKTTGPTIGFPDVCKTPILGKPVAAPYVALARASKSKSKRTVVKTSKGNARSLIKTAPVAITKANATQHAANAWANVEAVVARVPKAPKICKGKAAVQYWDRIELWTASSYQAMALAERVSAAARIIGNARNEAAVRATVDKTDAAIDRAIVAAAVHCSTLARAEAETGLAQVSGRNVPGAAVIKAAAEAASTVIAAARG